MNAFLYRLMVWEYSLKAALFPPGEMLGEIPLQAGMTVLDFGCGPGRYTLPAARLVGEKGKVCALDAYPPAIRILEKRAARKGLRNIRAIQTDHAAAIADNSIDVVLLYNALHEVKEPSGLIADLHRALKAGGLLSFRDHHLQEEEARALITGGSRFELHRHGRLTYTFRKLELHGSGAGPGNPGMG